MNLIAALLLAAAQDDPEGIAFFERFIRPVLVERCTACHSAKAGKVEAKIDLDTREGMRPALGLLLKALRGVHKELLTTEQVLKFDAWIKMGAPDPRSGHAPRPRSIDFPKARESWPYAPVKDPPVPKVKSEAWPRNDVDRFILARLEERGIAPVEEADRRTLIRRATFDLTGLPPEPEEIDAFLSDASPDAFAKVVERLIASRHYGERWGRHWLDVVRYADTAGDNSDYPVPQLHLYRNYVIDAFNADVPYDRFIREQIAGDTLPSASEEERVRHIVATGYLANAKRFGSRVDDYPWHLTVEDAIDNLGRTFLGLTVSCARCHDHKFDPVSTADYYALYGIFQSTRFPWPGIELEKVQKDFVPLISAERIEECMKPVREKRTALEARVKELETQKAPAKEIEAAKKERDRSKNRALPYPTAYAVTEAAKAVNARIQIKGQPANPGEEVRRRFLEVLGGEALPEGAAGSGRRELAGWLADPRNPLTGRVMVNRIWQHHFGKGIVSTPGNFGKQGRPPTHPELLDFLATRFTESGLSIKAMHRLIMLSRTYQLCGRDDEAARRKDPSGELLWRFPRRRLEAEAIRDAMLAVSGTLDRTPAAEPHPFPAQDSWDFTQHKPFRAVYETDRRSVYLMTQRFASHPFLGIFDGADTNAATERRGTSTTPLQALWMMNNPFVHEQARKFSARLLRERTDDAARLERAFLLAFGRPPSPDEVSDATRHLESAGWESLARVLLRANEFVYVH